jgi:hypothetical protein
MDAPKNTKQAFMGDTATADIPTNSFQRPTAEVKVVNVKQQGAMPKPSGVNTPGPNE